MKILISNLLLLSMIGSVAAMDNTATDSSHAAIIQYVQDCIKIGQTSNTAYKNLAAQYKNNTDFSQPETERNFCILYQTLEVLTEQQLKAIVPKHKTTKMKIKT
jgi:hypothetical protein